MHNFRLSVRGQLFHVRADKVCVGQSPNPAEAGVVISEPGVAAEHLWLQVHEGKLWARDAGSMHGTYVNGARLAANVWVEIANHSTLTLGQNAQVTVAVDGLPRGANEGSDIGGSGSDAADYHSKKQGEPTQIPKPPARQKPSNIWIWQSTTGFFAFAALILLIFGFDAKTDAWGFEDDLEKFKKQHRDELGKRDDAMKKEREQLEEERKQLKEEREQKAIITKQRNACHRDIRKMQVNRNARACLGWIADEVVDAATRSR